MTIGDAVYLKSCPHGQPGIIRGERRGKFIVEFSDLAIALTIGADRLRVSADTMTLPILQPSACARAKKESATTAKDGAKRYGTR